MRYTSNLDNSSHTFWRFAIQIPLSATQMRITYQLNNGQELNFWVPGRNENMRYAAHSVRLFLSVDDAH